MQTDSIRARNRSGQVNATTTTSVILCKIKPFCLYFLHNNSFRNEYKKIFWNNYFRNFVMRPISIFKINITIWKGSSVGIATDCGMDSPGIEFRWGRDFPPVQTGPGAHPASCKMGTGSFPGVKWGRGVLLITHPLLLPLPWKSRAILLPTPGPHRTCNGITLPFITIWKNKY